jgi:hypothetical protein
MDLQLTCGGRIHILVRALRDAEAYVSHWVRARERRESATAFTALGSGTTTWCDGAHASGSEDVFARVYRPRVRLVLVGSDPIALALIEFAARLGIEVRLVRPNGPTEAPRGLTADAYDARALPAALAAIRLDAFTAVYALSHEAAIDLAVLEWALRSPAFCVGALGSRNKIPARLATLRERGIDEAALERLHLPQDSPSAADRPWKSRCRSLRKYSRSGPRRRERARRAGACRGRFVAAWAVQTVAAKRRRNVDSPRRASGSGHVAAANARGAGGTERCSRSRDRRLRRGDHLQLGLARGYRVVVAPRA